MAEHQSRNESVDAFRMLAALCVIIVHTDFYNLPRDVAVAAKLMSFWVIPFFFIVSGYFLAEKSARTKSLDVQGLVERMGWIFMVWTLIYLPIKMDRNSLDFLGVFDMATTPIFLYYGTFYHLWYLSAMAVGCLFIAVCYRYNVKYLIPIVSIITIMVSVMASGYRFFNIDFTDKTLVSISKYWRAVPFIYAGFLIQRKGILSSWVSLALVIIGTAMMPFEVKYIRTSYGTPAFQELLIGVILFGVGMACLSLNNLKFLQSPLLARWGREYSLGIYLLHPMIIHLFRYIPVRAVPFLPKGMAWDVSFPVIVLFICLALLGALKQGLPSLYNIVFGIRAVPQQH